MLHTTDIMPLGRRQLLATTDLLAAREHLSRCFWPHTVRLAEAHPRVYFRHNSGELAGFSLNALRYGTGVVIESEPADDSFLIMLTLDGHAELHQDGDRIDCGPGSVAVMNPTRRLRVRLSRDHNQLTLRVDGRQLRAYVERELGLSPQQPVEFLPEARLLGAHTPGVAHLVAAMLGDLDHAASGMQSPHVARHLESCLIGLLLAELPHNYTEALARRDEAAGPAYVCRVEDFIREHACDDLGLDDLVNVAGTSRRALQAGFRRYRNTTPMRYLRHCRLERARAALRDPADTRSVSEVALDCGFNDLSKFARFYREHYGETPSASRR